MLEAADHGDAPAGPAASAPTWPAVMTKSAYGEYRRAVTGRGSAPMVTKYIATGKIAAPALRPDGKIDRVLADAQLARTLNMAGTPDDEPPAAPPPAPDNEGDEVDAAPPVSGTLAAEQTALTKVRRRKVELEIAQTEGRLVDKAEATREIFDIGRRVRDRIMAVPGRIAAHLVGKTEREIAAQLREAISEALNEAADDLESDGGGSGDGDH